MESATTNQARRAPRARPPGSPVREIRMPGSARGAPGDRRPGLDRQPMTSAMNTLDKEIRELKKRLGDGLIQRAYRGIISHMSRLRTVFADQRGERKVGGLYQGHFDMTCFALFPDELKERDLKLAVVFNYETFGFEVWLAARNRKVQRRYWELFRNTDYKKHRLVEPAVGVDAIVTAVLATSYPVEDEDSLTTRIVDGVAAFERDIVSFLHEVDARNDPRSLTRQMQPTPKSGADGLQRSVKKP